MIKFFLTVIFLAIVGSLLVPLAKIDLPSRIFNFDQPSEVSLNVLSMRTRSYPGSRIKIEQTLSPGKNYNRYLVSFYSENLKEYAYMTIPSFVKPTEGFPVIIINHGYQIPNLYTPDGNYIPHMDALAQAGFIIFKPDYRGHGKSSGEPASAFFSPNYSVDTLNAIASVKKFKDVNPKKIGIWGHSMGASLSLRAAEVSPDIKGLVLWSGVTGSYNDIIYNWQDKVTYKPDALDLRLRKLGLDNLLAQYGTPTHNPDFWNSIDPLANLDLLTSPTQIHVGLLDNQVPPSFSRYLSEKLKEEGKATQYYEYPTSNHDIDKDFSEAITKTIEFFNNTLK